MRTYCLFLWNCRQNKNQYFAGKYGKYVLLKLLFTLLLTPPRSDLTSMNSGPCFYRFLEVNQGDFSFCLKILLFRAGTVD